MLTFDQVYEQYQPMISSIILKLHIYRDHDVFHQAALIALWKVWENYDEEKGSFAGYAYRSMYGAVLDELKKTSKDVPMEDSFFESTLQIAPSTTFKTLIDSLSVAQQHVLLLSYVYGYTASEIAVLLHLSEPGIKKRKKAALRELRKLLLEDSDD